VWSGLFGLLADVSHTSEFECRLLCGLNDSELSVTVSVSNSSDVQAPTSSSRQVPASVSRCREGWNRGLTRGFPLMAAVACSTSISVHNLMKHLIADLPRSSGKVLELHGGVGGADFAAPTLLDDSYALFSCSR
jgi:hypothetical protein